MWLLYYSAWIIGYIVVAIVVTWQLAKRAPRRKGIVVATLLIVFVLIPTWDVIPSRMAFDALCRNEAGIRIYKKTEGIDGLLFDGTPNSVLLEHGYRFVEGGDPVRGYKRIARDQDGSIRNQDIPAPTARYRILSPETNLSWRIVRLETVIEEARTGERLGVSTRFWIWPGWVFKFFNLTLECTGSLGPTGNIYLDFYTKVLKPVDLCTVTPEK